MYGQTFKVKCHWSRLQRENVVCLPNFCSLLLGIEVAESNAFRHDFCCVMFLNITGRPTPISTSIISDAIVFIHFLVKFNTVSIYYVILSYCIHLWYKLTKRKLMTTRQYNAHKRIMFVTFL